MYILCKTIEDNFIQVTRFAEFYRRVAWIGLFSTTNKGCSPFCSGYECSRICRDWWQWSDGSQIPVNGYEAWQTINDPRGINSRKLCVALNSDYWNNLECDIEHAFICKHGTNVIIS